MKFNEVYTSLLNEAFSNGIRKTWYSDAKSNSWDGEIKIDDKIYYADVNYDLDFTRDEGDNVTPPSTTIDDIQFRDAQFHAYNDETGEYDTEITLENNPELYNAIKLKVEEKIAENEYERL